MNEILINVLFLLVELLAVHTAHFRGLSEVN